MKAFSILMLFFALVSKNFMPCSRAIYEKKFRNEFVIMHLGFIFKWLYSVYIVIIIYYSIYIVNSNPIEGKYTKTRRSISIEIELPSVLATTKTIVLNFFLLAHSFIDSGILNIV